MAANKRGLIGLVSTNIRARRKALGLTQAQVADALSVEFETISRYERGVMAPSLAQLERLADVLEVQPEALLSADAKLSDAALERAFMTLPEAGKGFITEMTRAYAKLHGKATKKRR